MPPLTAHKSPPKATFTSKKDLVYQTLRSDILSGIRPPGTRLVIQEIADYLQISPIPVREALNQLAMEDFVEMAPHIGARVAPMDVRRAREIFAVAEALEVVAGRAACEALEPAQIREIESHIRKMDGQTSDPEGWSEANLELHALLCRAADTRLVESLMGRTLDHLEWLHHLSLKKGSGARITEAQQEHWEILEALKMGDPDEVEQRIRSHNRASLQAYEAETQHGKVQT